MVEKGKDKDGVGARNRARKLDGRLMGYQVEPENVVANLAVKARCLATVYLMEA